jgi:glycosyltransferase involved in cell wall biosynthesis
MRVLFITGEFPPLQGGVGDCTYEIAKGLARLGVESHVLTTAVPSPRLRRGLKPPGTNRECDVDVHRLVSRWNWSSLRLIRKMVRELPPTIVHIQYQTGSYGMHPAINFLPRVIGTPSPSPFPSRRSPSDSKGPKGIVITFHDLKVPYLFPKAGGVRKWVTRFLARSGDAVIATNEEDFLPLQSWGLRRLALIAIGSNIPIAPPSGYQRAAWRARLGVGEDETLLCYFGFLNESKGGETLIRALAQIPGAKLLMIGGQVGASDPTNVAYLARVRNLIAELGLAPRVEWTNYTPASEVSANLLASDICVLPYRDGASYRRGSFMAALAHGLPIVTTSPPSLLSPSPPPRFASGEREAARGPGGRLPALRDGENVLLVPPDDPRTLADSILRVATLPELRMELSRGARELAAHFSWDKISQQHLELYKLLVGYRSQASGLRSHET